jgi:hypothetical protein
MDWRTALRLEPFQRLACAVAVTLSGAAAARQALHAVRVVGYSAGTGAAPGHRDPAAALGDPARMSGFMGSQETVTPFQPAYRADQVVSIGAGGWIELELGAPATNDPSHPFGVDLIVFGNAFFADMVPGAGVPLYCAGEGGSIELSEDGQTWFTVPGVTADGPMPTMGWVDAGPYDILPGGVPTDFRKPMDPAITESDLIGLDYADVVAVYGGSAGGVGVDLAWVGLQRARFVRISHAVGGVGSPEIDAVTVLAAAASPADLDGNGTVDAGDISVLLTHFGQVGGPADLDGSGVVDAGDISVLLLEMS